MNLPKASYHQSPDFPSSAVREETTEYGFIGTLQVLKCDYRPDVVNRTTLAAIWHTTSSGKTLTSFKVATPLKENDHIHNLALFA